MEINAFHLEQYKMLREEIMFNMNQLYSTETYTAVAVAAVYAWLLVNKHRISVRAVWFIPSFLIFVSSIHCLFLSLRLSMMGGYLRRIEEVAFKQDTTLPGWERYLNTQRWVNTSDFGLASIAWVLAFGGSMLISRWASKAIAPGFSHKGQPQTRDN
jgi:hypothetical protein